MLAFLWELSLITHIGHPWLIVQMPSFSSLHNVTLILIKSIILTTMTHLHGLQLN